MKGLMKLTRRLWEFWYRYFGGKRAEGWFASSFMAVGIGAIVGGIIGSCTKEVIGWITLGSFAAIPSVVMFGGCLGAAVLDLLVGLYNLSNWLVVSAWNGTKRKLNQFRTWARSNDSIFDGSVDRSRFEVEYHPEVKDVTGIEPLAAITEFVSDQRQKKLEADERITLHGTKCDGEHMTALFTLSRASSKTVAGVKKDGFKSVTVEVRFHFIPTTRSLHIDGAGAIPLDRLAQSESSTDVLDTLMELRLGPTSPAELLKPSSQAGGSPSEAKPKRSTVAAN